MATRDRREALSRPYAREHERSIAAIGAQPRTLRELVRALRAAVEAESVDRLHVAGVEAERGTTASVVARAIAEGRPVPRVDSGGSHLGTPRWSHDFRAYLTGSPFAVDVAEDGVPHWRRPLRSSVARLELSSSGVDRLAARTVHALPFHHYNVRETWESLCGRLADPAIAHAADAWAAEALRRWWERYVEMPRGRPLAA